MNEIKLYVVAFPFIFIAFLGGVLSFIAVNPSQNFSDTRNAQRSSDVLQILNAVTQYTSEQGNNVSDFGEIVNCDEGTNEIGTDGLNLGSVLVPDYIVGIPLDPEVGTNAYSGYTICIQVSGRIQIAAPYAEGTVISVSR